MPSAVAAVISYDTNEVIPFDYSTLPPGAQLAPGPEVIRTRKRSVAIYPDNAHLSDPGCLVYHVASAAWPLIPEDIGSGGSGSGSGDTSITTERFLTERIPRAGISVPVAIRIDCRE